MEKNKTTEQSIKILNRRSFIIIFIGFFFSFFVILRLFSLQVINSQFYRKKSVERSSTSTASTLEMKLVNGIMKGINGGSDNEGSIVHDKGK